MANSVTSHPSATVTEDQAAATANASFMLDQYLQSPSTITERLAFPAEGNPVGREQAGRRNTVTKQMSYLEEWERQWKKADRTRDNKH
ncbi:hypothetical protein QQS21_004780 [Conoideocrella luteorostrata]|uniref:Uncharacterized protein n=1 Tax=Conoideocrella luteorostrata TaxID=1105319 RepID=A0AAJ0CQL8_9HYPO|nr:hypothetical protein QQS21_004780 [Conoideocrella luteorostrata]